ncbi:hypothetical protein C0J52_17926 [Blattella germanica]|nr:hypothetical protein C0J52_17926 [Blattella germanica]
MENTHFLEYEEKNYLRNKFSYIFLKFKMAAILQAEFHHFPCNSTISQVFFLYFICSILLLYAVVTF